MTSPKPPVRGLRRGVAILPSLFTTANLFLGFWAMVKTVQGHFGEAAQLIGAAIVMDLFDGRIARMTGTASEFGAELDSLADVISFGVAPALLAYCWGFSGDLARVGWLAAFLFLVCGTLRLARFNVQRSVVDGRYFVGMPIPVAAGQVAAIVHFIPTRLQEKYEASLLLALLAVLGLLMVSTIRYQSFKNFDLRARRSYVHVLLIALALVVVLAHPEYVLLSVVTIYSLSGPAGQVVNLFRRGRSDPPAVSLGEAH